MLPWREKESTDVPGGAQNDQPPAAPAGVENGPPTLRAISP